MKTLKEFDYDLWAEEKDGQKRYYVRVKSTREVTEVSIEVMRILANDEKKMRRNIKKELSLGKHIRRWLNAKPCVYVSDRTGQRIEIDIGNEREAIYYFLIFCKKIANNQEISEDFRDYIALIISRSNSKNWEEC